MKSPPPTAVKATLLVLFVIGLVSAPFVFFGQDYVMPWLEARQQQTGWLVLMSLVLLAADSIAPVPATLVIWFLAAHAGKVAGILGGTVGLCAGVLTAGWVGRAAVGRLAPKFMPDAELARLREALSQRLVLTLACLRSVPVLAETSVILAAAMGIPVRRIFWATVIPNLVMAVIYSIAADDSLATACITFLATMVLSYGVWRLVESKRKPA